MGVRVGKWHVAKVSTHEDGVEVGFHVGASPPTSTSDVQHGRRAREGAQLAVQRPHECNSSVATLPLSLF